MLQQMKTMARPYATLFCLALVVALLARLGLLAMDISGTLSYDYISASGVPILDVICSILTGSTLVAFMFLAGLVLVISTAGMALYAFLFERGYEGAKKPLFAFLWGWATALVALICAFIVGSGILSSVQVGSMSSKLPSMGILVLALIVFAAFIGTLLAAASQVVCLCIAKSKEGKGLGLRLILAAIFCGLVVVALTVGTFTSINTDAMQIGIVATWFIADLVANVVILLGAYLVMKRPAKQR